MKITTSVIIALFLTTGCVDIERDRDGGAWDLDEVSEPGTTDPQQDPCANGCEEPNPPPRRDPPPDVPPTEPPPDEPPTDLPPPYAQLDGVFVSGHLGTYDACPEDGLGGPDAGAGLGDSAACEDPTGESCGIAFGCEHGLLMIRVSNIGNSNTWDTHIASLDLHDGDGELRAELPILEVIEVETGEAFDGILDPYEEQMLRITFRGPANPSEYLAPLDGDGDGIYPYPGTIEVDVDASNADAITIISTDLTPIPLVDT